MIVRSLRKLDESLKFLEIQSMKILCRSLMIVIIPIEGSVN